MCKDSLNFLNQNKFKLERSTDIFPKKVVSKKNENKSQNFQNKKYMPTPKGPNMS